MAIRTREKLAGVSRMATSLAHDINNPLASVTNLLFLLENEKLSEDGKQYLATARRELSRVAQISAQALGFYRSKGEPVWLSLVAILDDALALHQNRCRTLGVEVSRDYEPAPNINTHPGELRQVMVNLIGNALDAMPSGGRLRLRVRRATDWVTHRQGLRITVADTGDGMNAETRSRLFEPFFVTKKPIGTGMGLWICADIASKYNGRISVRSSDAREHNGSVFSVFLRPVLVILCPFLPTPRCQPDLRPPSNTSPIATFSTGIIRPFGQISFSFCPSPFVSPRGYALVALVLE